MANIGKLALELVESPKQIEALISKALLKEVDKALQTTANKLVKPVRVLVKQALMNQPEVTSLDSGQLAAEFGLADGGSRIEAIIDIFVNDIQIQRQKASVRAGKITSGFKLHVIKGDYSEVLSSSYARVETNKGQELPWLEWLLRFGDKTIIRDYEISFDPARQSRSRTGQAVMIKVEGGKWRVPPQFAGTPQNNFVTRAIDQIENDIIEIMQKQLKAIT